MVGIAILFFAMPAEASPAGETPEEALERGVNDSVLVKCHLTHRVIADMLEGNRQRTGAIVQQGEPEQFLEVSSEYVRGWDAAAADPQRFCHMDSHPRRKAIDAFVRELAQ